MTDQTESIQEIFERRMVLVGEMSRLNAEQLLNTQKLSGNQIDLLRCADGVRDNGGDGGLRDELAEAEARDALLKSKIADCDDRLQALEEQVAALDRKLEKL